MPSTLPPVLAAWLHDLDPVALRMGPITIYWYGISYVLGFFLAYLLLRLMARRGLTPIPGPLMGDVIVFGGIGGVIGGRLGYILLYEPALLTTFTKSFPFWQALNIAGGGMASHGGFVGALAGLALMGHLLRRRAKAENQPQLATVPTTHLLDLAAAAAPIGLLCGRLANFVNGELLGKVVAGPGEPAPWWAVRFPQEMLNRSRGGEVTDDQWQAATEAVGMSLLELERPEGMERFWAAYGQLVSDLRAGSPEAANFMQGFLNARHPSQIYQAAVEGVLLLVALVIVWAKPRAAGVVGAWFLILYGLGRIATEVYRLPDTQFAVARPLGLSRGQWLSVGMVAAGVGLLAWVMVRAKRRRANGESQPVFGGWFAPAFGPATAKPGDSHSGTNAKDNKPD